jgi:hypothetical protein
MLQRPLMSMRTPLRPRIKPATRERLMALAAAKGQSLTALVECWALGLQTRVLAGFSDDQQEAYRAGELDFAEVLGRAPRPRRLGAGRRDILALDVTIEAAMALQRLMIFTGYSLPLLLGILARQWHPRLSPGEPEPVLSPAPEMALDPALAAVLEPEPAPEAA